MPMHDAFFLLCYSWMSKEDLAIQRDDKDLIFKRNSCVEKAKESDLLIQSQVKKKGPTKKGKACKSRICDKVIFQNHKTLLIASLYETVLLMFMSFIFKFKHKSPPVHKLHLKVLEITKELFAVVKLTRTYWIKIDKAQY